MAKSYTGEEHIYESKIAFNGNINIESIDLVFVKITITDTIFDVTGLIPNTSYDFYVRAYCSSSDVSGWSLCETYTTFEVPVSEFPYENKFDDVAENEIKANDIKQEVFRKNANANTNIMGFWGTATVAIPNSLHALITRIAISPRLAIKTFLNITIPI